MVDYYFKESEFTTKVGEIKPNSRKQPTYYPYPLPEALEYNQKLVLRLDAANRKLAELSGIGILIRNPRLLIQPYIRKEAVSSSKIEGTKSELIDVYRAEESDGDVSSDLLEVQNHIRALEYGLSKVSSQGITLDLVKEMHRILLRNVRGQKNNPGVFKNIQNFISPTNRIEDAEFIFSAPENVDALMADFIGYANNPAPIPALIRAGLIHYQFETIHPFLDGNGRIGRALIPLYLIKEKLLHQPLIYPSSYFEKYRTEYYDRLMDVRRAGSFDKWLEFFLVAIEAQSDDALIRTKQILDLNHKYRDLLREKKAAPVAMQVMEAFFESPVSSIGRLSQKLNIHFQTVQRHVALFEKLGLVNEITSQRRNRLYMAKELFEILNEKK